MKLLFTILLLSSCVFAAHAQTNASGINGSGNTNGNAYSNGNIPNENEQNQNRPDSTLRSADTTYQHQQWNAGSTQQPAKKTNKRSAATSGNTTKKKK